MSLKIHLFHSPLDYFQENFVAVGEKILSFLLLSTSKISTCLFLIENSLLPKSDLFINILTIRSWFIRLIYEYMIGPFYLPFQNPLIDVIYSAGSSDVFAPLFHKVFLLFFNYCYHGCFQYMDEKHVEQFC